jgi:hypothetical protein
MSHTQLRENLGRGASRGLSQRSNRLPWEVPADSKKAYDRTIAEWLASGRQLPQRGDSSIAELILAYWKAIHSTLKGGRHFNARESL